jgi:hypothetical protein
MAFGKRRSGLSAPLEPLSAAALPPSALPGAQLIAPVAIEIKHEADTAGASEAIEAAAARIEKFLLESYNGARGAYAETVLSAAGALAGFAAQEAIWEGFVRPGKIGAQALVRVKAKSGETYLFGDLLSNLLASTEEGNLSLWRFVAAAASKAGAQSLPPLGPIFAHSAETIGTPAFDVPSLPGKLALKELPRKALRHWPQIKSILLSAGVAPPHWPWAIAMAAEKLILRTTDAFPPDIAALVVMQAAIRMSKVDPRTVPGGTMVD